MKKEIWKPVKGYEGRYEVSNIGRVRSLTREERCIIRHGNIYRLHIRTREGRLFKQQTSIHGYFQVNLRKNGNCRPSLVHHLVYEAFIGSRKNIIIDHIDRNRKNNKVENLRTVSKYENAWNCKKQKGKSGFIGVYKKPKSKNIFRAYISHNKKQLFLGYFKTPEEAARAYDKKCLELRGEFAVLNFPNNPTK